MPSKECHLAQAKRNQQTLDYLLKEVDQHSAWVATVAFYKALHLVEAVFATDPNIRHGHSHEEREDFLKSTRKYSHIWKHYRLIWAASVIARYLEDRTDQYSSFDEFMTPDDVKVNLVGHWLQQVEQSASKILSPGP